jgi:hypothetical protein
MSDAKYFVCRWVMHPVKPRDAFFRLFKAAEEVKIEIKVQGIETDDDGYKIVRLIARTPSKQTLRKLVDFVGAKIGLTAWLAVKEADFANGEPLSVITAKDLGDAAQVYGKANDKRRKKAERKQEE